MHAYTSKITYLKFPFNWDPALYPAILLSPFPVS